jgi:hypothetical protein
LHADELKLHEIEWMASSAAADTIARLRVALLAEVAP